MNILLTGATGFVGKVWLAMALEHTDWHFTLIARGGTERMSTVFDTSPCFRALRARFGSQLGAWLSERITVLDLDLSRPVPDTLRIDPDLTLHFAGITDFDPDPAKAIAVNIDGATRIAALAGDGPLIHVSTCYVAGNRSGRVPEALYPCSPSGLPFDAAAEYAAATALCETHSRRAADRITWMQKRVASLGFPNIYTWSKAVAEQLVLDVRPDAVIVRPSIVECARSFPFPGWNEGVNTAAPLTWLISTAYRELPAKAANRFDVVPVDTLCRGIFSVVGAVLRGEADTVYQIGTSDCVPLTFDRVVELTALATRKHHPDRWTSHLDPMVVPGANEHLLSPKHLGMFAGIAKSVLGSVSLPGYAGTLARSAHRSVSSAHRSLRRVEAILRLFKPFIHDNDWEFATDRVRALPDFSPALAYDAAAIDWRSYWVDVQYPGLWTWSIPKLLGETVENDPPSGVRLFEAVPERRSAK